MDRHQVIVISLNQGYAHEEKEWEKTRYSNSQSVSPVHTAKKSGDCKDVHTLEGRVVLWIVALPSKLVDRNDETPSFRGYMSDRGCPCLSTICRRCIVHLHPERIHGISEEDLQANGPE